MHLDGAQGPVVSVIEVPGHASARAVENATRAVGRGLILKGYLLRDVRAAGGSIAEILGPGDVIFSREHGGDDELLATSVSWRVLERTLVAELGGVDAPEQGMQAALLEGIARRLQAQTDRGSIRCALESLIRVDLRLLAYLWHLASTYGVVTAVGVKLELPLTHALLAELIGARRPTVTTAFGVLTNGGYVKREGRRVTLLGD